VKLELSSGEAEPQVRGKELCSGHHMSVYSRRRWLGGISDAWLPRDTLPVLKLWIEVEGGTMLKVQEITREGKNRSQSR